MNARTISYILDGIAVRLREGLNHEGYGLQEAARRLRDLGVDAYGDTPRDADAFQRCDAWIDEVVDSLQDLTIELQNASWHLEFSVKPKEAPAPAPIPESPSETLHKDYPEGVNSDDPIPF